MIHIRTKWQQSERINGSDSTSSVSSAMSSTWGSVRTRSNSLDQDGHRESSSNQAKANQVWPSPQTNKWQTKAATASGAAGQQVQQHPFEVLRGLESGGGSKDGQPANHSHFQWGESVTRSPAHPIRHK
jgi:hypothetical protein